MSVQDDSPLIEPEVVHIAHSLDGYPLCWPQDRDGEFTATSTDADSDCAECRALVAPGGECAP